MRGDLHRAPVGMGAGALDALGDEIELDFGFGAAGPPAGTIQVSAEGAAPTGVPAGMSRSKDAGKTCKERFNYASLDCAAQVHKHNREAKSGHSILLENKETYMLNKCAAPEKFFIVELCDDILVDTVVLANFEFFSSVFKDIKVSVSDRYPVKATGWKELGTYVAKNTRDVQAFLVENPLIWARYIKIDILSYYGDEYYCPVSLLRVHGTTMMEEFRHESASARGGFEEDVREDVVPEAVADPIRSKLAAPIEPSLIVEIGHIAPKIGQEKTEDSILLDSVVQALPSSDQVLTETQKAGASAHISATTVEASAGFHHSPNNRYRFPVEQPSCPKHAASVMTNLDIHNVATAAPQTLKSIGAMLPDTVGEAASPPPTVPSTPPPHPPTPENPEVISSVTIPLAPKPDPPTKPSTQHPPTAVPTTQESFFKSVHKRLTVLESNSTLSLQYIEEQSRLMRDTFAKMSANHNTQMAALATVINESFAADLARYRAQHESLWESTVGALEAQRAHAEAELAAARERIEVLADEVIWMKRVGQASMVLLVVVVAVVLLGRGAGVGEALAAPLSRHLRTRNSVFRGVIESPSPPTSPESATTREELAPLPLPKKDRRMVGFGPRLRVDRGRSRFLRLPSPLGAEEEDTTDGSGEALYDEVGGFASDGGDTSVVNVETGFEVKANEDVGDEKALGNKVDTDDEDVVNEEGTGIKILDEFADGSFHKALPSPSPSPPPDRRN